jgi:hypothetical protein
LIRHDFYRGRGLQDKFIVLLCDLDADPNIETPAAFVTSQGKHYPRSDAAAMPACGCPKESCFRIDPPANHPCFDRRSFVEFGNQYQACRGTIDAGTASGDATYRYRIQGQELSAILKCALQSDDIAGEDEDRIRAAYKAMAPTKKVSTTSPAPGPPPTFAAALGIVGLKTHFERHCKACQADVLELMFITEVKFRGVLSGAHAPPDKFLEEAEEALRLVRASSVAGCSCKA